ncbi:MAG: thiol:disulfide interchange protein, partial [Methyloprofundus sp.]|nr:thiol:disulfide interchange protein [Methyloprofundus sp.]
MHHFKIFFISLIVVFSQLSYAVNADDLLPPEQAFKVSAKPTADGNVLISWEIAEGYYLYRKKISFKSKTPAVSVESADLPAGEIKHDEFFGDMVIYRHQIESLLTLNRPDTALAFSLSIKHQGCADKGLCYPPQKTLLTIQLPAKKSQAEKKSFNPLQQLSESLNIGLNLFKDELLPADQAFQFFAVTQDGNNLQVNWKIAEGYYLYRGKIDLQLLAAKGVELLDYEIPHGIAKYDEAFGDVEILHDRLSFRVPLSRSNMAEQSIVLKAKFQGCAERGVCYPPMEKTVNLLLPAISATAVTQPAVTLNKKPASEQDLIIQSLQQDSFALTLLSFLGFGLLLAFTPCVFPMIPILSGIIVGQGKDITHRKAFLLSLSFVLASAVTYTVFGILAALFGSNLQASFQAPWIIYLFSGIFILLSLSMFGFYN